MTVSRCGAGRREDWNRRYSETEFLPSAEPNRFLVAELAGLEPATALDLACGEGRNAVWLAAVGWQVTGVDFSEVGLARAADLAQDRAVHVHWVEADLREYRPQTGAFDLVCVLYLQLPANELVVALLTGLVVERAERVRRPVGGGATAIDALVRARRP